MIEISVKTFNDIVFKLPLNILIEKGAHSTGEIHLDVGFKHPLSEYPQMTGLFGKIGNQRFEFHDTVQLTDRNDMNGMTSLSITGRLTKAEKLIRKNSECFLVNFNHLLIPMKIDEFRSELF